MIQDDIQFHYNYEEGFELKTIFMGITDSSNPWYSIYDGFIGKRGRRDCGCCRNLKGWIGGLPKL